MAYQRRGKNGARPASRGGSSPSPEGGRRQQWTRVARVRGDAVATRLSAGGAGVTATASAAAITMLGVGLIIMAGWVLGAGEGGLTSALNIAGISWLATQHIPVNAAGGTVSQLPLGLMLIPALMLWRAGIWAARRSGACRWQEVRALVLAGTGVYASICLMVAGLTGSDTVSVSPLLALVIGGLFCLVVFGASVSREAGLWPMLSDRFSPAMHQRLRAGLVGILALAAGAAALLTASMILHFGPALDISAALDPGLLGNFLLLVLSLTYIPNALIWAMSFVLGPGFAAGAATAVSPFGVDVGAVPAFPLLASLPESAAPWAPIVLIIPLAAGAISMRAMRRGRPLQLLSKSALRERVWVAGIVAVAIFILTEIGSGSLGPDRMSDMGPNAWVVAPAAFILFFVGGLLGDFARHVAIRFGRGAARKSSIDLTDGSNGSMGSKVGADAAWVEPGLFD